MHCPECGRTMFSVYFHNSKGTFPISRRYCSFCRKMYKVEIKEEK